MANVEYWKHERDRCIQVIDTCPVLRVRETARKSLSLCNTMIKVLSSKRAPLNQQSLFE